MSLGRKLLGIASIPGMMALAAMSASASIIPTLVGTAAVTGGTQYQYRLDLTTDEKITNANPAFQTFYDINNLVSGSGTVLSGGPFTVSEQNVGITAFGTAPSDNPAVANITFTYTGGPILGPAVLGTVAFTSSSTAGLQPTLFTGQANKQGGATDGTITGNIGFVAGPGSNAVVPEPSTWGFLLSSGVAGSLLALRRRSAKRA